MRILVSAMLIFLIAFPMVTVFTPQVFASENVVFQDDFESYAVGTFPSAGGWSIVWNGAGNQYQIITSATYVSPTRSFQLVGRPSWSVVVKKDFSSSSRLIGYEVFMRASDYEGRGYAGFGNIPIEQWGRLYAGVGFWYGVINAGGQDLQSFTPGVWYGIRVVLDRNTRMFDVWIDGVLKGEDLVEQYDPWEILSFEVAMGWLTKESYFDDVKVFEVSGTPPQNGLVGYWNFDEGSGTIAHDSSGNNNHGALNNGPVWVDGKVGKALSFDGATNFVQVEDSASLDMTTQISIEAWVYPRALVDSSGYDSHIISKCDLSDGTHRYNIGTHRSGKWFYNAYTGVEGTGLRLSNAAASLNKWTYLAMTYDGSAINLYIDGLLDSSYAQSGPILTTTAPLGIGSKQTGAYGGPVKAAFFNGMIDEVRIYNRALSQQEIQTDMGEPSPPPGKHDVAISLVGLDFSWKEWCLDLGDGTGEIKEGQTVKLFALVSNPGSYDEIFELNLHFEDLETDPTRSFFVKKVTVSVQSGGFVVANLDWDTRSSGPLTDGKNSHLYGVWVEAHLPEDTYLDNNVRSLGLDGKGKLRVSPIMAKNWQVIEHEDSSTTIKWEFPDNFQEDGSAAHNHRRDESFYVFGVWDGRDLTYDKELFDKTAPNYYNTTIKEKGDPWFFYYGHGFISSDVALRYYFVDKNSWPKEAKDNVAKAFQAYMDTADLSRPDLATGIFFEEQKQVSDPANPWKDAEIILKWTDLGDVRLGGDLGSSQPLKVTSGETVIKKYMEVEFNSRTPLAPYWGPFLPEIRWWYGDPEKMPTGTIIDWIQYQYVAFYSVCLHEIGHVLGLPHMTDKSEVMATKGDPGERTPSKIAGETRESILDLYSIPAPYLTATIHSPAHLLITDPFGRQTGFDPITNTYINTITYAKFSEIDNEPETIIISWPLVGTYLIQLIGVSDGSYTLDLTLSTDDSAIVTQSSSGTITNGSIQTFTAYIAASSFSLYSWDYVFEDTKRDTTLRINTKDKYFQFVAPDKDFGVKYDPKMTVLKRVISIRYEDKELRLVATAVDEKINFCSAVAWDKQTRKTYVLIDKPDPRGCSNREMEDQASTRSYEPPHFLCSIYLQAPKQVDFCLH